MTYRDPIPTFTGLCGAIGLVLCGAIALTNPASFLMPVLAAFAAVFAVALLWAIGTYLDKE